MRKAIDLRSDSDAANDAPRDLAIDVVRVPIRSAAVPVVAEWPSMQEAYAGLLGHFRPEFARAVTEIARANEPIVVHCWAGRDRTGLVAGLLLRLAGVDLETIAADHALSDVYLEPWWQPWHDAAPDEETRQHRLRVTTMPEGAMADVLADLDAREYVRGGGVDEALLDRLVARLRGEA